METPPHPRHVTEPPPPQLWHLEYETAHGETRYKAGSERSVRAWANLVSTELGAEPHIFAPGRVEVAL